MNKRFGRIFNALLFLAAAGLCAWKFRAVQETGTLEVMIVDGERPTPARVELLDADGNGHIAEDALLIGGD